MFKPVKEWAWSRVSKAADISRVVRIVIFPCRVDIFQDVVCKFEQSSFGRVEFAVCRLKRAETGRNRYVGEKACKSKSFQNFANNYCIYNRNGPEIRRIRF